MIGLWLSVRLVLDRSLPMERLDQRLTDAIDGVHVDIHTHDTHHQPVEFVAELRRTLPALPYDLHFIDGRIDEEAFVRSAAEAHPLLRRVYSRVPHVREDWGPCLSTGEVASGRADDLLVGASWVLVTAPAITRPRAERADLVSSALTRIRELRGGSIDVVLDRDVDALAAHTIRENVAEIVVGKAILTHEDPAAAAYALRRAWGTTA